MTGPESTAGTIEGHSSHESIGYPRDNESLESHRCWNAACVWPPPCDPAVSYPGEQVAGLERIHSVGRTYATGDDEGSCQCNG